MSASVRRLRKPGNTRPEHRQAVYIEEEDVVRRSTGNTSRHAESKRFGGDWDKKEMDSSTNEKTPLLDETRTQIHRVEHEQTVSTNNLSFRSEILHNETEAAFKKMPPPGKPFWKQCCACCYRSNVD